MGCAPSRPSRPRDFTDYGGYTAAQYAQAVRAGVPVQRAPGIIPHSSLPPPSRNPRSQLPSYYTTSYPAQNSLAIQRPGNHGWNGGWGRGGRAGVGQGGGWGDGGWGDDGWNGGWGKRGGRGRAITMPMSVYYGGGAAGGWNGAGAGGWGGPTPGWGAGAGAGGWNGGAAAAAGWGAGGPREPKKKTHQPTLAITAEGRSESLYTNTGDNGPRPTKRAPKRQGGGGGGGGGGRTRMGVDSGY
ncbi:MAG: hypothetical protein L6R37_007600 [Teloschistes peruensis]|nr:MAG: hypothetical protein L6R37_007600 [Teloschistes peruensis]